MKKNLRMLCLGLAASAFTASFAQAENVTAKLFNADMEQGVIGWTIDFESHIWKKNTKNQAVKRGFHGVNATVLENWKSDATSGLSNNTISQTVSNLPNGTYVFGAYVGATQQGTTESNRDAVVGVTMFANNASVAVATDNPDNAAAKWAHTAKFNVAATVIDGTLTVGLKAEATNANYLVMDNATLYYFGTMDEAAALDEMAKIDMAATVAIADTCLAHKMNVDSLALVNEAAEAAKAVASADAAWQADEDLYWAIYKANKSIADYRGYANTIAKAEEVLAVEWSDDVADQYAALEEAVAAAKAAYEAATFNREEIAAEKTALNEAIAQVKIDSLYIILDEVVDFYEDLIDNELVGTEPGLYSEALVNALIEMEDEARMVLSEVEAGEVSAVDAIAYIQRFRDAMQEILDNPVSMHKFPIVLGKSEENLKGYKLLDGATTNESDVVTYTSQLYTFSFPLTRVRFIVKETGSNALTGDYPFFTLSSFEMFDAEGNEIELTEADITSNACHNTLNSGTDGAGIPGLVDDDPATFFHSTWGTVVNEHHYLEVTLPAGEYTAFSFAMTARGTSHPHQFPAVLEITHLSDAAADLASAISSAKVKLPYTGTDPGFYKEDVSSFYAALAAAEALVGTDASDEVVYDAIDVLEEEQTKIDEMSLIMPEAGKKYRLVSADYRFFENQNVQKVLTVRNDTLWWETASPDSLQQEFILEAMPNNDGAAYYKLLNVQTNRFVSSGTEGDYHPLLETADTVELIALGAGQFGLKAHPTGVFHACDHNSGKLGAGWTGDVYGPAGGLFGDYSRVIPYGDASLDGGSAWYIREMHTLPHATKSLSDLNFQSEAIHLYEGVNTLVLEADKDCAFADLVVYDGKGNVINADVNKSGKTATVVLDVDAIESFSFVFANAEGVATVTVNGSISKLSELQAAYDETVAVNPQKGDAIGQYSDLVEYNAALDAAEAILASGGSDDEIVKAIAALDSAVVHLQPNMPLADKTYFILSGLPAFKETHGVDMALYVKKDGTPAWSYVGISSDAYLWKFIDKGELVFGNPAFYLQNVASGTYMEKWSANSTPLTMVADTASTQPFRIDVWGEGVVTISDANYSDANLHFNGHGGGANAFGNIVYWGSNVGTASALRIVEREAYIDELAGIEDIEIVDEYVAPAKKGIYDLFGRRIDAPAAAGIYIVDGKKRVIKK